MHSTSITKPTAWLRSQSWQTASRMGLIGAIVIAICSYMAGATRARGGVMQALGLFSLTFGHMSGIFAAVLWIGILLLVLSWAIAGGLILRRGYELSWRMLLSWTVPLAIAAPLMSRDIYSYLMQGTLARDGMDAYQVGAAANPGPLLFEVSGDWRNTATPYGPAHLWLGEGITTVTGDNITAGIIAFKILTVLAVWVLIWSVSQLAAHFGLRPSVAVWIGVANPLVLLHLLGGLHTESMMMALVTTGLVLAIRLRPTTGLVCGSALIAIGVALKATAAIALPFLVWIIVARVAGDAPKHWLRETASRLVTLVWTALVTIATTMGVMVLITWASGQTWGWIAEMSGNTKVINPLALPSLIASTLAPFLSQINDDITFNIIVAIVRPWSMILMLLGLAIVWWLFRHNPQCAILGATLAYAVTCVFNSVTLPWYYIAPLVLVGVCVRDRRGVFFVAWASVAMCFMFDGGGNNRLYDIIWVAIVCVLMWLVLRATLGYTPGMPEEKTDEWQQRLNSQQLNQSHGLGAASDLTGEVAVQSFDGSTGQ